MVYEQNVAIPETGWGASEAKQFLFDISDNSNPYNLYINVRNTSDYIYSNLWLFVTIEAPEGRTMKDTIECPLADVDGRWYGSGIGDIFDNRIMIKKDILFASTGQHMISIQQAMRTEKLKHILNIGLRVEKSQ